VSFANVVLAVCVRIEVDLAGSSEADGGSGDEDDVAEIHSEECFGSCLSLLFVVVVCVAVIGCRLLNATGRTFISHFEQVTVRTLRPAPSLTSKVGTTLTSKVDKNDIVR
jgi:hypothetical protein